MTQYEQGYTDGELDGRNIGYQEGIKQGYKIMSGLILQKVEHYVRGEQMRTLNGEVLIDDNGNLNEQVWINNLIALAELMKVDKQSDDSKDTESVSK